MAYGLFGIGLVLGLGLAWVVWKWSKSRFSDELQEAERRAIDSEKVNAASQATVGELRKQLDEVKEKAGEDFNKLRDQLSAESQARVRAETEKRDLSQRLEEEKRLLEEAKSKLSDTFKALAGSALDNSAKTFLSLAKETFEKILSEARGDLGKRQEAIGGLVKPLSDSLQKFEEHVRALEKNRQEDYTGLKTEIQGLFSVQEKLQKETANLVTALRTPRIRGRWGELTLRRVVELSGMSEHCHFTEQVTVASEEGRLRPDLVIHMPAGLEIVVDAKVPLDAYLDAVSAESEQSRKESLLRHAAQVKAHMTALSAKSYWEQFETAPQFVVMFIPGDSFLAVAADSDYQLIEYGFEKHILLATPTNLIALLKTVAYGWRQEQLAKNFKEISELGKQLYERMKAFATHIRGIGEGLEDANQAYNGAVRSLESRVLPAARRFKELGVAAPEEIEALPPVDSQPRHPSLPELNLDK